MAKEKKRSGLWRWVRRIWLALMLLTLVFVAWLYWAQQAPPSYWQVVDTRDPIVAEQADQLEQWTSSTLSQSRPLGEPWQAEITEEQANGWLATRLELWEANRGGTGLPPEAELPMVAIRDDGFILAAKVSMEDTSRYVGVAMAVEASDSDGPAQLRMVGIHLGRLDMDLDEAIEGSRSLGRDDISARLHEYQDAIERIDLVFDLVDGRVVEIIDVAFHEKRAVFTCRTLRR